jgi:alpha-galactosidase
MIPNLPSDCCVEMPVLVDRVGLHPCYAGELPPQLAGMCLPHISVQELTVRAALEGKRDYVHHAAALDRHAASMLSLDELHALVEDLIAAHGNAMPLSIRVAATPG